MLSLPPVQQIIDGIVVVLEWALLLFPILSVYVTLVHLKWFRLYKPSPLIRHLLISSMAVDISSFIIAFLAAVALGIIDVELPTGIGTILVASAVLISLGVKVYRRINLRGLDHPDMDVEPHVESQDQREDREFGEQRRELEEIHTKEEAKIENQE